MGRREERNKGICTNIGKLTNTVGEKVRKLYVVYTVQYQRKDKQIEKRKVARKVRKEQKISTKWRVGKISETKKNYFLVQ